MIMTTTMMTMMMREEKILFLLFNTKKKDLQLNNKFLSKLNRININKYKEK